MATITFKGITQNSSISRPLTDQEFLSIQQDYYKKPDKGLVDRQFQAIAKGGVRMNFVQDYYLKEVMSKAIGTRASWSIWDGIRNREIMEYFNGKIADNKKVFPDTDSLATKIATAFRLCGIRYCVKVPNFPVKVASRIIAKYNVNDNYYDYSCGWAARLLACLQNNVNYYGTDPNNELVDRLNEIAADYHKVNSENASTVSIKCQGSQTFVPEWEGKMGLCFSSPPYFSLEDYQIGEEQSYKNGMTYAEWRDGFIKLTVENCFRYLVPGGYFIFNVKSFRDYKTNEIYPIERDFLYESLKLGMEHVCIEPMTNIKRCHGAAGGGEYENGKKIMFSDNDERMHVFKKP